MGVISRADTILSLVPRGVIGLESALAFQDLCTFSNDYIIFLNDSDIIINDNQFIRFYNNLLSTEDIIPYNEKFLITSPDRTVCEMILNDRREDFIIEALECYLYDAREDLSLDSLYECAIKYNVASKIDSYIEELSDTEFE